MLVCVCACVFTCMRYRSGENNYVHGCVCIYTCACFLTRMCEYRISVHIQMRDLKLLVFLLLLICFDVIY